LNTGYGLLCHHAAQNVSSEVGNLHRLVFIVDRSGMGGRTVMFVKNVIAHRIDKRAQTVGLPQTFFAAQGGEDPDKDFLPEILDGFNGVQAGAQASDG